MVAYDPSWPQVFEHLRVPIWQAVQGFAHAVVHVGSTSVPGLIAKPIIDLDIIVPSRTSMSVVIDKLAEIGYRHCGNLGIVDREAFESPPGLPSHHLYACIEGCFALENHLAVRDYLRNHPSAVASYGALKRQLAERFATDPQAYSEGKSDFLLSILDQAGCSNGMLHAVRAANEKAPSS
ncbi:MAG TPA: GrpB family protein [Dyella sp.]|uniref:GrpB family protein n=1 Tax=Dyella sp. TaxID=1869338 RepID=UPI002F958316